MPNAQDRPVVLVTGASGDIGLATARVAAGMGWRIFGTSLGVTEGLAQIVGTDGLALAADLTDPEATRDLVEKGFAHFGRLDGLVNCAGASSVARFHEQDTESWQTFLDINLSSAFYVTRAFIDICLTQPPSPRSIVLISSLAAISGGANPAYGAGKGGVCTLTYNIAQTYGAHGLRANAVAPGVIDTQMVRQAFPGEKFEQLERAVSARTPAGRLGRPEDVAELCGFLLSDRSSFITGTVTNVSGGFELVPPIGMNLK